MTEFWFALGVLLAVVATLAMHNYSLQKRLRVLEHQNLRLGEKMRQELTAINSAAIGVGQRLISAEKKLKAAVEQNETQTFNHSAIDSSVQAAYSTGSALSAQELTDRYGLSEAEANLMVLLKVHSSDKAGAL